MVSELWGMYKVGVPSQLSIQGNRTSVCEKTFLVQLPFSTSGVSNKNQASMSRLFPSWSPEDRNLAWSSLVMNHRVPSDIRGFPLNPYGSKYINNTYLGP